MPTAGTQVLHVYVCAALLTHWSEQLQQMEFQVRRTRPLAPVLALRRPARRKVLLLCAAQDLVVFLQHLPTSEWTEKEVSELLSQAYVFKTLYHHAPSHLGT